MDELADMTVAPAHLIESGIDILIGADYYWTLVCGEVKKLQGALVAVKTEFGWTLQGAIPSSSSAAYCSTVAVLRAGVFADTTSLSKELKSFWELESIGIIDSSAQTNEESEEVMSTFPASLEKMDTRYEVALPWKPLNMQLADNKAVAKKRLTNLTKKLMKDESTLIKYDEAIPTVRHHLSTTEGYPEIRKTISESLYVDDLITGANTVEEATDLYRGALDVMNRASMTLRKWNSNSKKLQQLFNDEGTGCALGYVECPTTSVSRVLGLVWDKDRDHLAFSMEAILDFLDRNSNTKRFILQASARIYDPLSLISPVTVTTKLMFQTLWELGIEWDAPLPEEVKAGWTQWHTQLHHLTDITVPRRYGSFANDSWKEVHIFTDASPRAYGAVVYLRISGVKEAKVTLVLSKSRVAPIKRISLPRLELMGMVMGARLREYLERSLSLSISKWYLWTDSSIALHWVRGPAQQWKPFVANRVLEIQQRSDPDIWNHCSGIENPADLLTRGVTPQVLKSSSLWWNGPAWLSKPSTCWPRHEGTADMIIADEERRTLRVHNVTVKDSVLPLQKYSSLSRLVRVTAWVLRFFHNAMHPGQKYEGPITTEEVQKAHTCLILQVQLEAFQEELQCLRRSTRMPSDSPIRDLSVIYDDDGVLRVGGRLNAAELSYNVKHPVILPSRHPFTELTISAAHRRLLHAGALETLTELREMYWIVRGRQMVKKVLKKCVTCNRFNSRAATEPVAPLPRERVTQAPPFDVTGADFAGPLNTKDQGNNRKSYIVIFTCAVTRAIHLELVTDMSTSNFLMAFRRFISRRGVCRVIFSDNARTFQRASKDLKRLWTTIRGEEIHNFFTSHQIRWKFIAEKAAWWGGFWERMVRSVKASLKKVLGNSYCNFEELTTILTEIEAVINSRPLTYVYTEASEPEPLAPSHFLVGKRLTTLPDSGSATEVAQSPGQLTRRWHYRQRMVDQFWRRWQKEYLTSLRGKAVELDQVCWPRSGQGVPRCAGQGVLAKANSPKSG
ncbi:uncharacterized protein LOC142564428 [Dermacentor variabilis]|uniref:uncharacterized protein LOC142564428 n=1 Tax=Dermacentor variabilis TaxID=34621 RepID=UPI003F5B2949